MLAISLVSCAFACSNLPPDESTAGPQTFRPGDAPRYVPAEVTIIVCWGVCLGILAFIHFYCVRQNKKKAQICAAPGYVHLENQEWLDLTDRENPEFVYTL